MQKHEVLIIYQGQQMNKQILVSECRLLANDIESFWSMLIRLDYCWTVFSSAWSVVIFAFPSPNKKHKKRVDANGDP